MKHLTTICLFLLSVVAVYSQNEYEAMNLTDKELHLKSDAELAILRNEIFARQGYTFTNKDYQDYFEQFAWYKPLNDNTKVVLSERAKSDIASIKQIETMRSKRPEAIKRYFSDIMMKTSVPGISSETLTAIKNILEHINLDKADFSGDSGGYSIRIDNGNDNDTYEIRYYQNKISVNYSDGGFSSLKTEPLWNKLTGFDTPGGSADFYIFSIDHNNRIKFEKIDGAG